MATLAHIAETVGVSKTTVFRVLNGQPTPSVPEAVRQAIRDLAAEGEYALRRRRRSVGRSRARRMAVVGLNNALLDANIPFFHQLTQAMQRALAARTLSEDNVDYVWSGEVASYRQFESYDRVIVLGRNPEAAQHFLHTEQTVLFVAAAPHPERYPSVMVDLAGGTRQAVQHLLSLGYPSIGYFGEAHEGRGFSARLAMFQHLLIQQGLYRAEHVHLEGDWTAASGHAMAAHAMRRGPLARAYFVSNDPMAIGAISAFVEAGLRVPEDVAVVGFDDIDMARFTQPPLTTVNDSVDVCARVAVNLALDGLGGELPPVAVLVPTHLVVRASSGRNAVTEPFRSGA